MSDLLPIVAGCKALTYNCKRPANNGLIVTVIEFIGTCDYMKGDDNWNTDLITESNESHFLSSYFRERNLLRVDGRNETELDQVKELTKS